ncbi:hypothetical protein [Enterococcus xiangfangensis]|uniref:Uncharacterized protein n=1 Tax=Enterococcus xiangfangensis TaxID=1296537 RepID=A0ABU3F834_9ENTE|nr:hypothetical protein [Enterococcus xiangfangensis]MBM7710846.1 hypothetical protein [Enterococcus xiangfangensis]MDT2758635.1 hypothetical protein [Enterococcus xiangfangensis]
MTNSFDYKGLTLTPTDLSFSNEELQKLLTFEGAITHERLKGFNFHYYLMAEYELNGLLAKLGAAERQAKRIYYITGQLVSSDLKNLSVAGYYLPTNWGFMQVMIKK